MRMQYIFLLVIFTTLPACSGREIATPFALVDGLFLIGTLGMFTPGLAHTVQHAVDDGKLKSGVYVGKPDKGFVSGLSSAAPRIAASRNNSHYTTSPTPSTSSAYQAPAPSYQAPPSNNTNSDNRCRNRYGQLTGRSPSPGRPCGVL